MLSEASERALLISFCLTGNMIGLHSDLRKTLSGEQIESMDSFDLESIINDVS